MTPAPTEAKERPRRIQLRRAKGWRMPPNTVNVARPTKYGNPFKVSKTMTAKDACNKYMMFLAGGYSIHKAQRAKIGDVRELRGKNLACWCPLSEPFCHANLLLELANE